MRIIYKFNKLKMSKESNTSYNIGGAERNK